MRSDYTDEQLDAIEKLTDSPEYKWPFLCSGLERWEDAIYKLHDIVAAKNMRQPDDRSAIGTVLASTPNDDGAYSVKVEIGQPVYYSVEQSQPSMVSNFPGDLIVIRGTNPPPRPGKLT